MVTHHSRPLADRATASAQQQLAGHTILRFTHADVTRSPHHVAAQIQAALATSPVA